MKTGKETVEELKSRQKQIKDEITSFNEKQTQLKADITSGEKALKKLTAEIQKNKSILDLKQSVYKGTYASIEAIQSQIQSEQHGREQLLESLKNAELEVAESKQRLALVRDRIQDRYEQSIPKNLSVEQTEEELKFDIDKISRSLESIGPVNMAVKDEHSEEEERLNNLKVQCEDLASAEENLRETIRKIDRSARKRFQETFDLSMWLKQILRNYFIYFLKEETPPYVYWVTLIHWMQILGLKLNRLENEMHLYDYYLVEKKPLPLFLFYLRFIK